MFNLFKQDRNLADERSARVERKTRNTRETSRPSYQFVGFDRYENDRKVVLTADHAEEHAKQILNDPRIKEGFRDPHFEERIDSQGRLKPGCKLNRFEYIDEWGLVRVDHD
jgi:hypothetical protein